MSRKSPASTGTVMPDHRPQQSIKEISRGALEHRFPLALAANAVHDVVIRRESAPSISADDFGRILQIGIHHHHRKAARIVDSAVIANWCPKLRAKETSAIAPLGLRRASSSLANDWSRWSRRRRR